MTLQQLRIIRETVRRGCNLTETAAALFTSQSGVSRHIKDLEGELGVELFVRKGKRLLDLTEAGRELLTVAERMLLDAGNLKRLAEQHRCDDAGTLTIATTHTQARYALPAIVDAFRRAYPQVHLKLHQGDGPEIVQLLRAGEADIGIATEALDRVAELVAFPYYDWHHAVIVPNDHPLCTTRPLSLAALAAYPLITYHEGVTGRARIDEAFHAVGLRPEVAISALDADVIKTYVGLGLGVGIVAAMACDQVRDAGLIRLDASCLFARNTTRIALRRGRYLRGFAYRFIALCAPQLNAELIDQAINGAGQVSAQFQIGP